jgi:hypothetical protein
MQRSITLGRLSAAAILAGAALIVGIGTAFAATTVVTPASLNGWYFYDDQTDTVLGTSTEHGFVTGPETPPVGTGSAHLTKAATDKFGIATAQFASTSLSDITALSYSTYRATGTAAQAPSLGFDVDSDATDADNAYQGRLTYEPYFTQAVNTGEWQTWDTLNDAAGTGTGNWWFSHMTLSSATTSVCTQANPCTWSELAAAYPNAAMRSPGQLILRTNGADGQAFDGNVDNLTVGISGTDTTFDFDPAAAPTSTAVTVTIDKFIDGQMATSGSATGSSFPMQSSWDAANLGGAGSGSFDLGPTGLNSNTPYEAVTSNMDSGSDYAANEVTGGDVVGASCADGKPFALAGYSVGDTREEAMAASTTTQSPSLTGIASDKFIIVHNVTCGATSTPPTTATTSQVTIVKYVDGQHATAQNASSTEFPFTATYQASNVAGGNQGSDPFTIGPTGNGTSTAYEAVTVPLALGAMYNATENTSGNDVVGASCADGKPFALSGYSSGDTLQQAISGTQSSTSPTFSNLQSDKFVIAWNVNCQGQGTTTPPATDVPPANACDTPTVAPAGYTLKNGSNGNDTVTLAPNTMFVGQGGNDKVSGGDGNYIVCTAEGNDTIALGDGNSTIDADGGNNKITVGDGQGAIMTGNGNDMINAGDGARAIDAGDGNNKITTGAQAQTITAGSGNDQISAGDGDDTVNADGGNNKLWGEGGDDTLIAAGGNDKLDGGAGQDTCQAGGGNNNETSCEL